MSDYTVQQGDCLSSIAHEHNFLWQTLWNDPGNAQLKATRKDPNVLYPGDVVHLPDDDPKHETRSTDQQHVFRLDDDECKLRIRLLYDDKPRAGVAYKLTIDGQVIEGQTDGAGWVEQPIAPNARKGTLELPKFNEQYDLTLGGLDPLTTNSGIQQRLINLGFYVGDAGADGVIGPKTKGGLRAFQKKYNLTVDGEPSPGTQAKLKEIYGS